MLEPRAVAAISVVEGELTAVVALLGPSDGDGAGARGERGTSVSIGGKEREGRKLLWS